MPDLNEIEQFVINAGSDYLPTFGGKFEGGVHCQQVQDEISRCLFYILNSGIKVNSYLEIGAGAGGTAYIINHFLKPTEIVLIDDNKHPKHCLRKKVLSNIVRTEIIGDSHTQSCLDELKETKIMFDAVLIDGDHTYHGVNSDIVMYSDFLNNNGLLILHDSALSAWGVKQAVADLKAHKNFKYVDEYIGEKGNVCGIALFQKVVK